jgi:hypothetical protein
LNGLLTTAEQPLSFEVPPLEASLIDHQGYGIEVPLRDLPAGADVCEALRAELSPAESWPSYVASEPSNIAISALTESLTAGADGLDFAVALAAPSTRVGLPGGRDPFRGRSPAYDFTEAPLGAGAPFWVQASTDSIAAPMHTMWRDGWFDVAIPYSMVADEVEHSDAAALFCTETRSRRAATFIVLSWRMPPTMPNARGIADGSGEAAYDWQEDARQYGRSTVTLQAGHVDVSFCNLSRVLREAPYRYDEPIAGPQSCQPFDAENPSPDGPPFDSALEEDLWWAQGGQPSTDAVVLPPGLTVALSANLTLCREALKDGDLVFKEPVQSRLGEVVTQHQATCGHASIPAANLERLSQAQLEELGFPLSSGRDVFRFVGGTLSTVGFGGGHTTTPQVEVIPQDNVAFARYLQTAGVCDLPKVGVNTASPRFLLGTVVATLLSDTVFPELALAGPGFAPPTIDPDALLPTCDASEFGPQLCSCPTSDPGCSPIFPFVVSPHVFGFEKTAEPQQRLRIGGRLARVTR